jgi:anti-anti-sigma factor
MALDIETFMIGTTPILRLTGALNDADVYRFSKMLRTLVNQQHMRVMIDMSNVDYINSHALGLLVAHHDMMQRGGSEMVIININPDPQSYFNVLVRSIGLDSMIRVVTTPNVRERET